jgi:hypothetical protein
MQARFSALGRKLVLVLSVAALSMPAWATEWERIWTVSGSTGTVDEADLAEVSLSGAAAEIKASAPASATVILRYPVVAVDHFDPETSYEGIDLRLRYRDNGTSATVEAFLYERDINTGAIATKIIFSSNSGPQIPSYQVGSASLCDLAFDFLNKFYYVEVRLTRTTSSGTPGIEGLQLVDSVDCP